jgi:hypothetical protein
VKQALGGSPGRTGWSLQTPEIAGKTVAAVETPFFVKVDMALTTK